MLKLRPLISMPPARGVEEMWEKYLPLLHKEARAARGRHYQYRGVHVGGAALVAKRVDGRLVFTILTGANRKFVEGIDPDRLCAEMDIADQAFRTGWEFIVGFVIYGPSHADDSTGIDLGSMIMCGHCRNDSRSLQGLSSLVTRETRFVSVNVETNKTNTLTVGAILDMCGGENDPAISLYMPRSTRAWRGGFLVLYETKHPSS